MKYKFFNILGIMSGTSADGIDISLVRTNGVSIKRFNKNFFKPFPKEISAELKFIIENYNKSLILQENISKFEKKLTNEYINTILKSNLVNECDVIGFHGQSISHNPQKKISLQIGDAQQISNFFKKKIIYNFRKNDIENNGQGAPLAPIYHKSIIEELNLKLPTCLINIGGISNISYWDGKNLIGFDCGPGNCLMDYVMNQHNLKYDYNGKIASSGKIDFNLLELLLGDSFFLQNYPKSLDKIYFNKYFKNKKFTSLTRSNLMATLSEFTSQSIQNGIKILPKKVKNIIFCGGGTRNNFLMNKLKKQLQIVHSLSEFNLISDFVEAELIAYLSARCLNKLPITFPNTTGVDKALTGGFELNPTKNH